MKLLHDARIALSRAWNNMIGNIKGYGGCVRCGDRWNWKPSKHIEVIDGKGCFPLCAECWDALPNAYSRLSYYLKWAAQWPDSITDTRFMVALEDAVFAESGERTAMHRSAELSLRAAAAEQALRGEKNYIEQCLKRFDELQRACMAVADHHEKGGDNVRMENGEMYVRMAPSQMFVKVRDVIRPSFPQPAAHN